MGKGTLTEDGWVVDEGKVADAGDQVTQIRKLKKQNEALRSEKDRIKAENEELRESINTVSEAERIDNIALVLQGFDQENDDLWTEEGKPRVEAVCEVMNDDTVTRAEIEAALPGFVRAVDPA